MSGSDTPPLADAAVTAWAKLQRVSRSMLEEIESELKAKGLPPLAWYDVLLELRREGGLGLRPFQLQERMLLAQYNLSRLIGRMTRDGLVERIPFDDDGRGQIVRVTAAGRTMQKKMWTVYKAAIWTHFARRLTDDDIKEISRVLSKLH